jgi:hypothetical protein
MIAEEKSAMLLQAACDFQAESIKSREETRKLFRENESSNENILRIFLDGLLAHLSQKLSEKIDTTDEKISYQIGLSSSFIRTHFSAINFVLDGDLIESTILCRKQLESLARMHEIDSKPLTRLNKKTPNISNVLKGSSGRMYGIMSEVAHFSTPRVSDLLNIIENGEMIGPSIYPKYNTQSHACSDMVYFVAIYFSYWFLAKLEDWYPTTDLSEEKTILEIATKVALECDVIRFSDE